MIQLDRLYQLQKELQHDAKNHRHWAAIEIHEINEMLNEILLRRSADQGDIGIPKDWKPGAWKGQKNDP